MGAKLTFKDFLEEAVSDAGNPEQAALSLLAAWRLKQAPELAAAIELLPVGEPPGGLQVPPQLRGAALRAWEPPKQSLQCQSDLKTLEKWAPDPRTASTLHAFVQRRFSEKLTRELVRPALTLLSLVCDPRSIDFLLGLEGKWTGPTERLRYQALAVIQHRFTSGVPALTDEERALVAKAVGGRSFITEDEGERGLLAAIYARPDDLAARAVYADHLLERGKPLGEFISLQLKSNLTQAERARMFELERRHLASHPLRGFLYASTFTRGFLSHATLASTEVPLPCVPEWSTVEELDVEQVVWAQQEPWRTWAKTNLRAVRTLVSHREVPLSAVVPHPERLVGLLDTDLRLVGTELTSLRHLSATVHTAEQLHSVARLAALRDLERLELSDTHGACLEAALRHLVDHPRLAEIAFTLGSAELVLTRGRDGRLSELWLPEALVRQHRELLGRLPDVLSRVVTAAAPTEANEQAFRAAFASQTHLRRIDLGFAPGLRAPVTLGALGTPSALVAHGDRVAATWDDGTLGLFDSSDLSLLGAQSISTTGRLSPCGRWLAEGAGSLRISSAGGAQASTLREMLPLGFSDDAARLWCADGAEVTCLRAATHETHRTLGVVARTAAFDRAGLVLLVDAPSSTAWLFGDGTRPMETLVQPGLLWAELEPSGAVVTLDAVGQLRVGKHAVGPRLFSTKQSRAHLARHPQGGQWAVSGEGRVTLVDASGGSRTIEVNGLAAFAPDGRLLVANGAGVIDATT